MIIHYTIVFGWYKLQSTPCPIRELKVIYPAIKTDNREILKIQVAESMGYEYPEEIDFRYFDVSYEGGEDE